jgi:hypothetical protein
MIKRYKKKPVVIEAVQFTGSNADEILRFCGKENVEIIFERNRIHDTEKAVPMIHTLEGDHLVSVNDYVIKGVAGEFYPCKPDIFAATYDQVI